MKRIRAFFIIFVMFQASGLSALVRTSFLSYGPSTEAYGRGETGASSVLDMTAAYYNPSLLQAVPSNCLSLNYFVLDEGAAYSFAGYGKNIPQVGFIGISAINLRSGDVELRSAINSAPQIINTNSWAYMLSYARLVREWYNIAAGVNVKYVHLGMYKYNGGSFAADAGLSRTFILPPVFDGESELKAGISAINLLRPSITLKSSAETYSTTYRLGLSWHVPTVMRALNRDTASLFADALLEDKATNLNTGIEYSCMGKYLMRAGMYQEHYTLGLGYRNDSLQIDYAMDLAGYANFSRFGVSYFWGNLQKNPGLNAKAGKAQARPASEAVLSSQGPLELMAEAQQALALEASERKKRKAEINTLYKAAKKNYTKKMYLTASEKFSSLIVNYPECTNAGKYYLRIIGEMFDTASSETSDFERLSYAKGYMEYKNMKYLQAINEWEKVILTNPERAEVREYAARVRGWLNDSARAAREKEMEEKADAIFKEGVKQFDAANWVLCIRKMEGLQEFCRSAQDFSKAAYWSGRANEYIRLAVAKLEASMRKTAKNRGSATQTQKPAEAVFDIPGSEKRYKEGLLLYAQGKTSDAINMWEIALRLNPNNERAVKALSSVRESFKK
jgi:tetratricopeptide (TPR) repeat protein